MGRPVTRIEGTARDVRREGRRLLGRRVESVQSVGKHLLIAFDNGWMLRTHLGMTGSWHVYPPGDRWRITPGKARAVVGTDDHVAVCFAAPTVELAPAKTVLQSIDHLGPDLMDADVDFSEIVGRARKSDAPTVADLLLDQRVMAGVGNVYKSEVLFIDRLHPDTPPDALDDDGVERLARLAARLLRANRDTSARSTTGSRSDGRRLWVYGRHRRQCRRCPSSITSATHGDLDRVTYWCPRCQPTRQA
jgi:endonuclease-8